jgi:hypothetical protein
VDGALARKPSRPSRPEDLEQLERYVTIGSASAFDLHYRLRPALVAIAEGLLWGRGVDLFAEPERARRVLGEDAWELLRPDRPPPEDRHGRALAGGELETVVAAVERVR